MLRPVFLHSALPLSADPTKLYLSAVLANACFILPCHRGFVVGVRHLAKHVLAVM
jgi:hypothetical protein